jgi:hypothetical protein
MFRQLGTRQHFKSLPLLWISIILIVATNIVVACQAQKDNPVLSPEKVLYQAESLADQRITIQGTIEQLGQYCTEAVCPETTPCCNSCTGQVGFQEASKRIYLTGSEIGCSGDSCKVTCYPFELGQTYIVTGYLRTSATFTFVYLDVEDFKLLD